jgi:hypothetical protein
MAPKKKKRKPSLAPAAKKRKTKSEAKVSDDEQPILEPEDEHPVIEHEPHGHDEDEDEDDGMELNIPEVMQKLETLCDLPRKPCEYFAERSADITISRKGSEILRTTADLTHFPKDLTDICVSYYEENAERIIQRVIDDFNFFADGKVGAKLRKKTAEEERVDLLLHRLQHRSSRYSEWFWMRRDVPAFVPLDNVEMHRDGNHCTLVNEDGYEIAGMCLHDPEDEHPNISRLLVGLPQIPSNPDHDIEWTQLSDSVPHADLIGLCLNKSTVTLDQMMKCSVELEARTKKSKDKWLSFLFDLHRAYAAIHLWIADGQTFDNLDEPVEARVQATILWDRFHRKYKCGQAICSWPEDREAEKKT